MIGTGVMAGSGFLFWLIAAHLYPTADVGRAGTLVATMTTLATFSLVGFDTGTIRFLASSTRKEAHINTGFTLIALVATLLAGVFLVFVDLAAPELSFIRTHLATTIAFVAFAAGTALNMFADAVFLAYRSTKYTLAITAASNAVKVLLPIAFVPWGAFGIFAAAASAQVVGFLVSSVVLSRTFGIELTCSLDRSIVKKTWRYSIGNYVVDFFSFLPGALLPIIVLHRLSAHESAYYYIVMMIVGLLYVIPSAVTNALFSEGSHDGLAIRTHTKKALLTIATLLIPAMLVLLMGGDLILTLFGKEYSTRGFTFLATMTLSGVGVAASALYATLFRLTHDIRALFVRNVCFAGGTIGLAYVLLPHGLAGVGLAYAGGTLLSVAGSVLMYHTRVHLSEAAYRAGGPLGRFAHLPARAYERLSETLLAPLETLIVYHVRFLVAWVRNGSRRTVLFYPERPKTYHILYKVCRALGCRITNDLAAQADCIIRFEDATYGAACPELAARAGERSIVNLHCTDISKARVEEVFREVFGYGMAVDPRTHTGVCVQKSNTNAVHDGRIVSCPREPEPGYLYQKLIDARSSDSTVWDLRIYVFGDTIPFVLKRHKEASDRFNITIHAERCETGDVLSREEEERVVRFCKALGLDYGEIDALRDPTDDRLYLVDANNTPAGPLRVLGRDCEEFPRWFGTLCDSFERTFLPPVSRKTLRQQSTPLPRPPLASRIMARLNEKLIWPLRTFLMCKRAYLRALALRGFRTQTIVCYPDLPVTYHALYKICHLLGYRMTNRLTASASCVLRFRDTTASPIEEALLELAHTTRVVNLHCTDISKARVEEVFREVFGYGMAVDPRTHTGVCVQKSNTNAVHDGRIVSCPREPEPGYLYQKLIPTSERAGYACDLRVTLMGGRIPLVVKEHKPLADQFNTTAHAEVVPKDTVLSHDEQSRICTLARRMGLDFGELDVLRSTEDGRLYVVDVNNTPAGPAGPLYGAPAELATWFRTMCEAFATEFLLEPHAPRVRGVR